MRVSFCRRAGSFLYVELCVDDKELRLGMITGGKKVHPFMDDWNFPRTSRFSDIGAQDLKMEAKKKVHWKNNGPSLV